MSTLAARLIRGLEAYGARHVFGIPGVHTVELYRAVAEGGLTHVTPRHEQGAAFMADGYARASGRPGVCLLITGPGLSNAATAMAQARADSVPMLVVTGVNASQSLGRGDGHLHELPDQRGFAREIALFSQTVADAATLDAALARAFALFATARPGPVHIEIPIDLMAAPAPEGAPEPPRFFAPAPAPAAVAEAAALLKAATRPLALLGGGAAWAEAEARRLIEAFDLPAILTTNARGLLGAEHPLAIPASPSLEPLQSALREADLVLAVGTELGPTDYDMYLKRGAEIPGRLVRIDRDPQQLARNRVADLGVLADAGLAMAALAEAGGRAPADGAERAAALRAAARAALEPDYRRMVGQLEALAARFPEAIFVGDSTQMIYAGNLGFEPARPRSWFNSSTGYGTLGYALPAAIGAKLAAPERPVVGIIGDGGLQFTLGELSAALDAQAPIALIAWNNACYGEIKRAMIAAGAPPLGVDLATPDLCALAKAAGWRAERLDSADTLSDAVAAALQSGAPTLIEAPETVMLG